VTLSDSVKVTFPSRSRDEIVVYLRERLSSLRADLPLRRVVLFGSWAHGRATAYSDVDVLVVYTGPPRDNAYRLIWHQLSLPGLEPHVYSETEATALAPVLERMTRSGIVIFEEPTPPCTGTESPISPP
jgi:uncharacterized protein